MRTKIRGGVPAPNSITELAKKGKIKVGDYVDYVPDKATYITNIENTGYSSEQIFETSTSPWQIFYIDETNGDVMITTSEGVNNTYLKGAKAFFRGTQELHNICKALYSNIRLGTEARSMTESDAVNAGIVVSKKTEKKVAVYPMSMTVSGSIEYNNDIYTKISARTSDARYYSDYVGGGTVQIDSDGFEYRRPTKDNPVFISMQAYYDSNLQGTNSIVRTRSWLANSCMKNVNMGWLDIYTIGYGVLGTDASLSTYGNTRNYLLRPIVILKNNILLNIDDEFYDGTTREKAWKLII